MIKIKTQNKHPVLTEKGRIKILKSLLKGKKSTDLTYSEYVTVNKEWAKKLPIIQVVKGYGIYAQKEKNGEILYHCVDMKTGLNILNNRKSLNKIIKDIKKGDPQSLKKRFPEQFRLKDTYESIKRLKQTKKKYGSRAKRFRKYKGQIVLDIGAGSHPDYRATHAIDLVKPEIRVKGLRNKWGYDFNSETTNLPYKDNSFHVVVSYGGLGRNFESKNICKEIYRVLKSGGRFEFNPDSKKSLKWLKEAGLKKLHMEKYYDEALGKNIPIIVGKK